MVTNGVGLIETLIQATCETLHICPFFLSLSHRQARHTYTPTHTDDVNHFWFSRKDDNTLLRYSSDGMKFPFSLSLFPAPIKLIGLVLIFTCVRLKMSRVNITGHPNRQLHLTNTHCTQKKRVTCWLQPVKDLVSRFALLRSCQYYSVCVLLSSTWRLWVGQR